MTPIRSDTIEMSLADVLIARGDTSALDEAAALVEATKARFDADGSMRTIPSLVFTLERIQARLAARRGDERGAARHAEAALALIEGPFESMPNPNPFEPRLQPERAG